MNTIFINLRLAHYTPLQILSSFYVMMNLEDDSEKSAEEINGFLWKLPIDGDDSFVFPSFVSPVCNDFFKCSNGGHMFEVTEVEETTVDEITTPKHYHIVGFGNTAVTPDYLDGLLQFIGVYIVNTAEEPVMCLLPEFVESDQPQYSHMWSWKDRSELIKYKVQGSDVERGVHQLTGNEIYDAMVRDIITGEVCELDEEMLNKNHLWGDVARSIGRDFETTLMQEASNAAMRLRSIKNAKKRMLVAHTLMNKMLITYYDRVVTTVADEDGDATYCHGLIFILESVMLEYLESTLTSPNWQDDPKEKTFGNQSKLAAIYDDWDRLFPCTDEQLSTRLKKRLDLAMGYM